MKKIINLILVCLGTIFLGLGIVGIVIPVLPTVPFLLLTLICYAKGSTRFEKWFLSTSIYKKRLRPFIKTRAMTNLSKFELLAFITILISIPIILVPVLPMRIVLVLVIIGHYIGFIFFVKSVSKEKILEMLAEIDEKEKLSSEIREPGSAEEEIIL
ncbi:MAG: YbaN family protein [Acholeplasmatales bacterium]|jgi:uncharacterized membrane protein YbaN (DUF454 family)|nr:YbaN family protein [Acholeplasmatales bacterium]